MFDDMIDECHKLFNRCGSTVANKYMLLPPSARAVPVSLGHVGNAVLGDRRRKRLGDEGRGTRDSHVLWRGE